MSGHAVDCDASFDWTIWSQSIGLRGVDQRVFRDASAFRSLAIGQRGRIRLNGVARFCLPQASASSAQPWSDGRRRRAQFQRTK